MSMQDDIHMAPELSHLKHSFQMVLLDAAGILQVD